jgi:CRISPR/Cas system-associated exonuclease Cas4 (RecB family)
MVERSIKATINGIVFSGVIDSADETTDTVYDLKTHSGRSPSFVPKRHVYQMTGYGILYEHVTGRPAKHLMIDLITRTGKYRPYELQPDRREFVDVLTLTAEGIMDGRFDPNGADANRCRYCPMVRRCTYARVQD